MQRRFKIVVAILPVAMLLGIELAIAQLLQDSPTLPSQDAQAPATSQYELAGSPGTQAPYTVQYDAHLTIRADHTGTSVETRRVKILTPAVVQSLSQQQLPFIEGMQALDVIEAFTEKLDGKRVPVDLSNIITRDAASGLQATYLRDLKQRTVIFPDVGVGDTLVWTTKTEILQGLFPGQFIYSDIFPSSRSFTSAKVTIEAPVALDLQVKATGTGATESAEVSSDIRRHTIAIAPGAYQPEEPGAVSPLDRDPSLGVSTFKSYEEMGLAFGKAALPKAAVTPEIASLAAEITRNIEDRKAQAVAIDAWVKRNIRYVAVYLSVARVVPNDAAAVLRNKFGDCKDKVTLMSALLAAKGIASEAVLINLGNVYSLPEPPTLAALNHVILYLPDFDLYDDPTVSWAAFGVLAALAYDKPVVRVSVGAAKLARTPTMRPEDHTAHIMTTINVAADGTVTGQTQESNIGVFGIMLRIVGGAVQTLGDETAARRQLQGFNTPGGGHFDLGNFAETLDPVAIKSSFTLNDRFKAPAPGGRAVIPIGMPLTARPGNFLLGTRLSGRNSAFVCYAGKQTEDIEATFDQAVPMPLPLRPTSIDNAWFSYRSTFKVEARTLRIHREFVSRVPRQTCAPELEAQIAIDMNSIRADVNSNYGFNSPPRTIEVNRVAVIGQKLRLDFLSSLNLDCSSMGFATVRVVEQPQRGTIAVEQGAGFSTFPQNNPRSECNKRQTDGTVISYEPNSGVTGADSVTVETTFPSGTSSKSRYAITINPSSGAAAVPSTPKPQATPPTSPQMFEFTRVAAADQPLRVAFVYDINPDCSSIGFATVRIVEQPKHGKFTVENGTGFSNFPQTNLRYECNKRRTDGVILSYIPDTGFIGADSITVDVILPGGSFSKRRYSIEVK